MLFRGLSKQRTFSLPKNEDFVVAAIDVVPSVAARTGVTGAGEPFAQLPPSSYALLRRSESSLRIS